MKKLIAAGTAALAAMAMGASTNERYMACPTDDKGPRSKAKPKITGATGVERARKREAAQRLKNSKRNAEIDAILTTKPQSRQVYRQLMRAEEKKVRSRRKHVAMRAGVMGGAAEVRGPFITA